MNRIIAVVFALFLCLNFRPLHAQTSRPGLGLYFAAGASALKGWEGARPGARGGLFFQFPIKGRLSLKTDLGAYLIREFRQAETVTDPNNFNTTQLSNAFNFLEISPLFVFQFHDRFSLQAGPYLSMTLSQLSSSRNVFVVNGVRSETMSSSTSTSLTPPVDYGIRGGFSFQIQQGVNLSAQYSQGLPQFSNISPLGYGYRVKSALLGINVTLPIFKQK